MLNVAYSCSAYGPISMASTIDSLPDEVLIEVFTRYLLLHPETYFHHLILLSRVSKHWQELAHCTPSLWTRVDLNFMNQTAAALRKSGACPLDVFFEPQPLDRNPRETMGGPFALACTQVHRWRSVRLQLKCADDLRQLERLPAPLLESIEVTSFSGAEQLPPFNIFSGYAPRLRSLRLTGISIPWQSTVLQSLQVLHLKIIRYHKPSVSDVISILSASPGLSELNLLAFDIRPDSAPDRLPIVFLPQLSTLKIRSINGQATQQILLHIRSPPTRSFGLIVELDGQDPAPLIQSIVSLLPEVTTGMLKLLPRTNSFWLYVPEVDDYSQVDVSGVATSKMLECLATPLRSRYPTTDLHMILKNHCEDGLLDILALFRVTHLETKGFPQLKALLDSLGQPKEINGVRAWLFPALRDLETEYQGPRPADIRRMLETRYGEPRDSNSGATSESPRLLDRVYINCGSGDVETADHYKVDAVVGLDKITWMVGLDSEDDGLDLESEDEDEDEDEAQETEESGDGDEESDM